MCLKCQHYVTETKIFIQSGQTDSNCNSMLFINTGIDPVNVDGLVLQPSQSWAIDGNNMELNVKTYSFKFLSTVNPGLTIIYKRYVG